MQSLNDFHPGDRILVTTRLGPNSGREGNVVRSQHIPSGTVTVVLEGEADGELFSFLPSQLEVIDSAPAVKAQKAPSLNRLLAELEADILRMLDMSTDVQSYRMKELSKSVAEHADILIQFKSQLKWAMRTDELLEEGME